MILGCGGKCLDDDLDWDDAEFVLSVPLEVTRLEADERAERAVGTVRREALSSATSRLVGTRGELGVDIVLLTDMMGRF